MKLCQFQTPRGGRRVGVVDGDAVVDITVAAERVTSVLDLVLRGRTPAGIERSAGIMVNYVYVLHDIEKNHESCISAQAKS